jgi:hypothetical protein
MLWFFGFVISALAFRIYEHYQRVAVLLVAGRVKRLSAF